MHLHSLTCLFRHHEVVIYCDHCRMKFPSVVAFESHYEAVHRNVCIECHKIFPASEWLQLHIDEFHNVLLQIKKERGDKIVKSYTVSYEKNIADLSSLFSTSVMYTVVRKCSRNLVNADCTW